MKFVNGPCSDMQGTRFFWRAKPMPKTRTLGDFFEKTSWPSSGCALCQPATDLIELWLSLDYGQYGYDNVCSPVDFDRPPVRFSRRGWRFKKTLYVQLTRLDFKNTISRSRENIFKKKLAQKITLRWKPQIFNNIANDPRSSEIGHFEVATSIRYRE